MPYVMQYSKRNDTIIQHFQHIIDYRNRFVTQYITYLKIRKALSGTLSPLSTHDRLILV